MLHVQATNTRRRKLSEEYTFDVRILKQSRRVHERTLQWWIPNAFWSTVRRCVHVAISTTAYASMLPCSFDWIRILYIRFGKCIDCRCFFALLRRSYPSLFPVASLSGIIPIRFAQTSHVSKAFPLGCFHSYEVFESSILSKPFALKCQTARAADANTGYSENLFIHLTWTCEWILAWKGERWCMM
jgi:hypothetical protein